MKLTQGLYRDTDPIDQLQGTYPNARNILINQSVDYQNIIKAFYLNGIYLFIGISLFYYSFEKARKKGTLINIGE